MTSTTQQHESHTSDGSMKAKLLGAWLFVGVPLAYGIIQTARRAAALFSG